ncbi:MAG: VPS10 domain-containing protein [Spirosomataceae bacterium]
MKRTLKLLVFLLFITLFSFAQKKKAKTAAPVAEPAPTFVATSASERMEGYQKRKQLQETSLLKNLKFRSIGPTVMSGRVVDIDGNPDKPSEFYVAYASGGLWYTNNNGQSFTPIFDNEAAMTIGDIAVDWKNNIIWIGTGENNSSRSTYAGLGMYKSTDGGKTWQHLGLEDTQHIGRIMLHPTNPNIAWVSAIGHLYSFNEDRGVYKTTDGGKTWKKTLFINDKTGAIDLQIDPQNPNILYTATWHRERKAWNFVEGGKESGIYKSTDGGESWKLITGEGSGFPQGDGNGRIGLAIYPKNPNTIYAIIDNQANRPKKEDKPADESGLTKKKMKSITKDEFLALDDATINGYLDQQNFPERFTAKSLKEMVKSGKTTVNDIFMYTHNGNDDLFDIQIVGTEVYRSDDGGATWKRTHTDYLDNIYFTYGYYFGQIWVAPDNADKIVIVGVPVLKSDDGGKTFKSIDGDNVHSDHHALWFNPKDNKHYINGNDGGINITYDDGKTWFKANTPAVGQYYSVSVDMAKPYNVYGGLQDNGVWEQPSTAAASGWFESSSPTKFLLGGDGMMVQVDWRDNNTVYTGFQFGNYFKINKATGERKYIQVPRELGEEPFRFNWEAPILLSRHNQDVLYYGSHRFHRSLDKAENWKTLSGDLTRGKKEGDVPFGTLTTIEESPLRFGLLYTGSDDGLVHISKDGGYTWSKIADYQNLWVSSICASNHSESTVYLTLNAYREDHFKPYLFVSNDYGTTWTSLAGDLPNEAINVVKEDPKNANILYVGTDNGLYVSVNKGKTFMRANGDMPAVAVHDLAIHPRDNELVVGTHGRSIWIADIKPLQALTEEVLAKDVYAYDVNSANYSPNWGRVNKYETPQERKHELKYYAKTAGKATIKIQTDKGLVLKTISDDAESGLNFASYDLTIDESVKTDYEKYLNDTKKKDDKEIKLEKAEDGKTYIRGGKYKVVFEANGSKAEKDLEIKTQERRSRRVALPQGSVSPDEFEEWYEEMGFEETKK